MPETDVDIGVTQDKSVEALCTVSTTRPDLTVDIGRFLAADDSATFARWKQNSRLKCKQVAPPLPFTYPQLVIINS